MSNTIEEIRNILVSKNYEVDGVKGVERGMVTFTECGRSFYLFDHFSHIKLLVFSHVDLEYTKKYIPFEVALNYIKEVVS